VSRVLAALPPDFPPTIVVVQHLDPLFPSIPAGAHDAVGDRVIRAVAVKNPPLRGARRARPVALEMEPANGTSACGEKLPLATEPLRTTRPRVG
jgi:chemotaxis response regulator CheB